MSSTQTTTVDALAYWHMVTFRAIELATRAELGDMGDVSADSLAMLRELSERGYRNCRSLAQSIAHDLPGGLRERMFVALVNHAKPEERDRWDSIPNSVKWSLEPSPAEGCHLSDSFSLHS